MEITKITSKGQVVIPSKIRKELKLKEGTQIVVSNMGNLVVMKKIKIKDPKEEFKMLTKWGSDFAKKTGIKNEKDVMDILHKGRGTK